MKVILKKWKELSKKVVIKNKWINITQSTVELPNKKILNDFYLFNYPDWVNMVVVDKQNRILICYQYRHGEKKITAEIPAGAIDNNEKPLNAAKRELKEETGYSGGNFKKIACFSPNSSSHTNKIHVYLVKGGNITKAQNLDDSEEIIFKWVTIKELRSLIKKGTFSQGLQIASVETGIRMLNENK